MGPVPITRAGKDLLAMACDAASRSRAGQFSLQCSSMRGSERELRFYESNMQSPFADLILEYFDACTCFCRSLIFPPLFVCGSGRLLEKNAGVAAVWETHTLGVLQCRSTGQRQSQTDLWSHCDAPSSGR